MIVTRDDLFRVVCSVRTPIAAAEANGTGIFVQKQLRRFLVSAAHVAAETTPDSSLILSGPTGDATRLPIAAFTSGAGWRYHPVADIAAVRVHINDENEALLINRFLPIERFALKQQVVSRDIELTIIGFPLGLGATDKFSPLTFRTFAASSLISLARSDTKTPCQFFVLEAPSVGGYSGGPVFDLGYIVSGNMRQTMQATTCYGFIHGTISDDTGGKLAAITPAFYLDGWL